MIVGRPRIVQKAECDPTRVKRCLDFLDGAFSHMRGGDIVGELVLAEIEKIAGDDTPFVPPGVGIDQVGGVARRAEQKLGGVGRTARLPVGFHQRQTIAWIGANGGGKRGKAFQGARLAANGGDAGRVEILRASKARDAARVSDPVGIEKLFHTIFVVGARQKRLKCLEKPALGGNVEFLLTPDAGNQMPRPVDIADLDVGLGQRHGPFGTFGRMAGKTHGSPRRPGDLPDKAPSRC